MLKECKSAKAEYTLAMEYVLKLQKISSIKKDAEWKELDAVMKEKQKVRDEKLQRG